MGHTGYAIARMIQARHPPNSPILAKKKNDASCGVVTVFGCARRGSNLCPQQKMTVPSGISSLSCVGPFLLIQSERLLGLDELRTAILAGTKVPLGLREADDRELA